MDAARRERCTVSSITVVIRAFNEEKHIGRLLTGIRRQTTQPQEIILVDSGSTDATLEIASRFGATIFTIPPERFSFGRSLNLGCEAATSDVIAIVSAHVFPVVDSWLERLTAPLSDPSVALAYGRQLGDASSRFSESQLLQRWFPDHSEANQSTPFCNNANAAIQRNVWEELRYDESLTGLEDMDWARRAQAKGYSISYIAEAPVVHVHEESVTQIFNRYRREAIAYKTIFGNKGIGRLETLLLAIRNIGSDYWNAMRRRAFARNLVGIPAFRTAQFWGTYRGFAQRGAVPADLKQRFYYPPIAVSDPTGDDVAREDAIDYSSLDQRIDDKDN